MTRHSFTPAYKKLPPTIPVFPLAGAVVMPDAQLPLNIFEPRYLNMVEDALGQGRMFAMVQPKPSGQGDNEAMSRTGCAGRITSFSETDDGRFLIVLTGVCRFDIEEELSTLRGYRRVIADWQRFRTDYEPGHLEAGEREHLTQLLRIHARTESLQVAWDDLAELDDARFVNLLACRLPFSPEDKQSLIESVILAERATLLKALLEMSLEGREGGPSRRH